MTIEGLLDTLGITDYPEVNNGTCTVYLRDSDIYAKVFERLENVDELTQDDVQVTDEENLVTYYSNDVYVTLDAQYDEDMYILTLEQTNYDYERKDDEEDARSTK